jgi:hypothetical protein
MFLEIVRPSSQEETPMGGYRLTYDDLIDPAFHPFLASTKWDYAVVEVDDDVPKNILRQIIINVPFKARIIGDSISMKKMQTLCEICPDEVARLRAEFTKGKEALNKLVGELKERYDWEWSDMPVLR